MYLVFGSTLVNFFMNKPSEVALSTGVQFLHIVVPFYFVVSLKLVADGILRGSGLMKRFMVTTFTDLILRVSMAVLFSSKFGTIGIWMAWPVGWVIGTMLSVIFYKTGPWGKQE